MEARNVAAAATFPGSLSEGPLPIQLLVLDLLTRRPTGARFINLLLISDVVPIEKSSVTLWSSAHLARAHDPCFG